MGELLPIIFFLTFSVVTYPPNVFKIALNTFIDSYSDKLRYFLNRKGSEWRFEFASTFVLTVLTHYLVQINLRFFRNKTFFVQRVHPENQSLLSLEIGFSSFRALVNSGASDGFTIIYDFYVNSNGK